MNTTIEVLIVVATAAALRDNAKPSAVPNDISFVRSLD